MPPTGEWALRFGAGRLLVCKGLKFGESLAIGRAIGNTLGGNDVREGSHEDRAAGDDAFLGAAAEDVEPIQAGLRAGWDPDQHVDVAGARPPRRHHTVVEQVGVDRGGLDSRAPHAAQRSAPEERRPADRGWPGPTRHRGRSP